MSEKRSKEAKKQRSKEATLFPCFLVSLFLCFIVAFPAFAQQPDIAGLNAFEQAGAGLATTDIRVLIGNVIRVFLGLLGTIAIVLILYAGFLWMTAAGNEEKIEKAKKILTNAAIGLAIVLSAYGITSFIISRLLSASLVGTITDDGGVGVGVGGRGSLGGGIVESHYPPRNAPPPEIPRNTKILVTFKEPMRVATIINDKGTPDDTADDVINTDTIKLQKTINLIGKTTSEREAAWDNLRNLVTNMKAAKTPDEKTFVFAPQTLLGSPSEPISYTMRLDEGIKKANGDAAFGRFGKFYEWQFEVSTVIDSTPPTVMSVIPLPSTTDTYARNVVVQVNFSEAVDPTTVAGVVSGVSSENESKIIVTRQNPPAGKSSVVKGGVAIANQYKTIEFVTDLECGKNSCGGTVYCLPGNETITVRVPSAKLTSTPPDDDPFTAAIPYTGVVDLASNALDGNNRKDAAGKPVADGPADEPGDLPFIFGGSSYIEVTTGTSKDDFEWTFKTNDTIDLTPPKIDLLTPEPGKGNVLLDQWLRATFSKTLMSSTFNGANVFLDPVTNYWTATELSLDGKKTIGIIKHDQFAKNTAYTPTITAGVKDGFQNCYFPCAGLSCDPPKQAPSCKLP